MFERFKHNGRLTKPVLCLFTLIGWAGCGLGPLTAGNANGFPPGDGNNLPPEECFFEYIEPVLELIHLDDGLSPVVHGDGLVVKFLTDGGSVSSVNFGIAGIELGQVTDFHIEIVDGSEVLASSSVTEEQTPVCIESFLVWSDLLLEYSPIYGPEDLLDHFVTLRVSATLMQGTFSDEVEVVLIW
tara:strand:- start:827 stop:1381 length:555 start_codon:yes stop_codon:yes gene_type:complete